MGELINGRTPEEIKRVLEWATCACGNLVCEECQYYGSVCSNENFNRIAPDALAYIEQLEVALKCEQVARDVLMEDIPKWISVEERLPEEVCRCLVITKRHEESSMVNTATYNHMGWWTHGNFGEITHWMPLPEMPEEEE